MDATHPAQSVARPAHWRRRTQLLLAVAGLATVLLASACDTGEQVPWASYSQGLQVQIDVAAVRGNCAALQALLNAAKATSEQHEKATGFPNDALQSYIQDAQARASCPTATS
jgi:hypothetical protein